MLRSGTAIRRATAFCTPMATAASAAVVTVHGEPTTGARTSTITRQTARNTHSIIAAAREGPRCSIRWMRYPPAAAPSRNAASTTNEVTSENSGTPAMAKPVTTTLPVMLATKTRPT